MGHESGKLLELEFHRHGFGLVPLAPATRRAETDNDPSELPAGAAILICKVPGDPHSLAQRWCGCRSHRAGKRGPCSHLKALRVAVLEFRKLYGAETWQAVFDGTVWCRLARCLHEAEAVVQRDVTVRVATTGGVTPVAVAAPAGHELARCVDPGPARMRFLARLGRAPRGAPAAARGAVLERLGFLQKTDIERRFAQHGMRSRRQSFEDGFWHRLAYHCVREYGPDAGTFHPAVDEQTGHFTLDYRPPASDGSAVRLTVPRKQVRAVLALLAEHYPQQEDLRLHPVPLRSIFRVSESTELDLEVRAVIQGLQQRGEESYLDGSEFEKFRYGDLLYVKELGVLAELERPDSGRRFVAPVRMRLQRSQVASFLDEHRAAIAAGAIELDGSSPDLQLVTQYDRLEIEALPDDEPTAAAAGAGTTARRYPVIVRYGVGKQHDVLLSDLLLARREGRPYFETAAGWVDLEAPAFAHLGELTPEDEGKPGSSPGSGESGRSPRAGPGSGQSGRSPRAGEHGLAPGVAASGRAPDGSRPAPDPGDHRGGEVVPGSVRLAPAQLLRLRAAADGPVRVRGDGGRAELLRRLVELRPAQPLRRRRPAGMSSSLRRYQLHGVNWLRFLCENRLGGLLCDDMGLGKTHQAMALMVSMLSEGEPGPFLVVCPTTVISHWRRKIADHAPGLEAAIYHGPERNLHEALGGGQARDRPGDPRVRGRNGNPRGRQARNQRPERSSRGRRARPETAAVLITSYGVLRRDTEQLAAISFPLVVLDEIQHLKNPETQSHKAAARLTAAVKIGLTGTPVENTIEELKALFDLVLPGYLGSGRRFRERYGDDTAADRRPRLRRAVSPFMLRRTKAAVLQELPDKIVDVRTCALSDEQVSLYREAITGRGEALRQRLRSGAGPTPYIHVFALLNLLKQICDHPALARRRIERADEHESGKWDLFRELLQEAIDGGHKAVVFSQYLGMIRLMQRHLDELGVGYETLTGATRERGRAVERFNEDPDCRVFLGSLKAGGTGIDLVGGSVVIHYDRWWNAAREDQATDRVHRIGQKRAVQVFKLISEGTLEERIDEIIARKRHLMESVVQEDDPTLAKIFTRDELLELIAQI